MILYVGFKDRTLALLLGIAYMLSIHILSTARLENTVSDVKPYVEPLNEIDNESSNIDDTISNTDDTVSNIDDKNINNEHDYLNSQFDDPLKSFKNLNQCNAANDIAVTDKDKEILENPCSLNKD